MNLLPSIKDLLQKITPFIIYWVYRLYFWTLRTDIIFLDLPQKPVLYAHYHGQEFSLVGAFARRGIAIMASKNKDGRLLAEILRRFGYRTVAGSSSRGGPQALTELIHGVTQEQFSCALAVDGPRGPAYQVKAGIILLAKSTGVPIIPAVIRVSSSWKIISTWDRTQFPKPFSKLKMFYGSPLFIPSDSSKEDIEVYRLQLEKELITLAHQTNLI